MSVVRDLVPFALFGFPSAVAVTFGWFRHRERLAAVRAGSLGAGAPGFEVAALEARLAHMEQVFDAMVAETERVSEGQRFVTQLLAERPPAGAADPAPARSAAVR